MLYAVDQTTFFLMADEIFYLLRVHYNDVIMTTMATQITSLTVVYSTVYSDADQRKHQSSASLAFVWGGPVTRKMFPFDDVIMYMLFYDWYFYDMCTDNGIARVEYTPFPIIVWQDDMVIGRRPICKMFIFVLNILTSISQKILALSVSQYAVSVIYSRHVMTWKRLHSTGPSVRGIHRSLVSPHNDLFLVVCTEPDVEHRVELRVIWDAVTFMWYHCRRYCHALCTCADK